MLSSKTISKVIRGSKEGSRERLSKSSTMTANLPSAVVLPAMTLDSPYSNRHEVKPALAFKLLRDIEQSVLVWQAELRRVVGAIDALHAQGPMVDGWLDSSTSAEMSHTIASHNTETTLLRHADADTLMRYVEALESSELEDEPPVPAFADKSNDSAGRTQYRLCWLDGEGNVCSQACPPEQMAAVSTAISRYQKCKQLLAQHQMLEARLQSVVSGLTGVRDTACFD